MNNWTPITESELLALIAKQLPECTPEQLATFEQIRTMRSAPILRFGNVEHVWIVAASGSDAIYYEDVEEGFNISALAADGSIAAPGYEQWTLSDVLHHWLRGVRR